MDRRSFVAGLAAATAAGAGILGPVPAFAAPWPERAFRRHAAPEDILQSLYGTADAEPSEAVVLKVPLEPANGANVPVEVSAALPEVESIALISLKNPVPLITQLRLHEAAPYYAVRVKLGATTQLSAYVQARGRLYVAAQDIQVTVGGCGGDIPVEDKAVGLPSHDTRMRARRRDGRMEVMVLIRHPMETGARKDERSGRVLPAHFIQSLVFARNGRTVAEADLGIGVAQNPLIGIALNDSRPGDLISLRWADNRGVSGSVDHAIA